MKFWKVLRNAWMLPILVGASISCGGGGGGESAPTPPPVPTGLVATAGDQSVALNWNVSSGATSYHVKRAPVGGSFVTIASPTGHTYTSTGLTNGTTYRFVVSAVSAAGESANSAEVTAKPAAAGPPTPTGLTAIPVDQGVLLSWKASAGATSYHVQRATVGGELTTVASPTTSAYSDSGLINSTTYRYTVSAVNGAGESAETAEVTCKPVAGAFFEPLNALNSTSFARADWANGSQFNVGWDPSHISFSGGVMTITLDDTESHNYPYASGEYRTNAALSYGLFETSMKATKSSGVVSSFFTYIGPTDGQPWDEIDIEFLGKDTTKVQFNYFVSGNDTGHVYLYDLGFDASAAFHTYAFEWKSGSIKWYVDGVLAHSVTSGSLPSHSMKMMMNLWTGVGIESWLGPFTYSAPLKAQYDYVRYEPR